jgi:DNA-binding transcriptional MerR regulator
MDRKTFSLDELCSLAGLPKRTVRYYIQIGLVDRPEGETRGAHYLQRHLEKLLRIRKLTESGISLERIREVLSGEPMPVPPRVDRPGSVVVRSHVMVADGIEIQIDPERSGLSPEGVRALLKGVMGVYAKIKQEKNQ